MSANNPNQPPRQGLPMPVKRVAEICHLSSADIYRAHTPEMGVPGHFIYPPGATQQSYTLEGLCALCDGLRLNGHELEAKTLAEEIRLQRLSLGPELMARTLPVASVAHRWDLESEARHEEIFGGSEV